MKLSQVIAKLNADLEANGDADHVSLGVIVAGKDGKRFRVDAILVDDGVPNIFRDQNYPKGMTCIVAENSGDVQVGA